MLAHDTLAYCLGWFRYQPASFFSAAIRYTRFGLHLRAQRVARPAGRCLSLWSSRVLVAAMWPAGAALYLRDRLRDSNSRPKHPLVTRL